MARKLSADGPQESVGHLGVHLHFGEVVAESVGFGHRAVLLECSTRGAPTTPLFFVSFSAY